MITEKEDIALKEVRTGGKRNGARVEKNMQSETSRTPSMSRQSPNTPDGSYKALRTQQKSTFAFGVGIG